MGVFYIVRGVIWVSFTDYFKQISFKEHNLRKDLEELSLKVPEFHLLDHLSDLIKSWLIESFEVQD